jgi:hypothetical protein
LDSIIPVLVGPVSDAISSDGMQTSRNRHGSIRGDDLDPEIKVWLKTHTVDDLKTLAMEMESKGENVSGKMEAIQALEAIEQGQLPRMGSG